MFKKILLVTSFLFLPLFSYASDNRLLDQYDEWKAEQDKKAVVSQPSNTEQKNEQSILYRNDDYKFRINFPAGWEVKDGDGAHVIKKAVKDGATVMVLVNADFIKAGLAKEEQALLSVEDIESTELNILSDEEINTFLETIISEQLGSFPGSTILEKGIRYVDNRKAAYFKMNQVYKVQDKKVEGISTNYFTIHKGKLYQIGGMYPTVPINGKDKESVINASLMTFVFEDWGDQVQAVNATYDSKNSPNPVKEALADSYGKDLNNFGLFLAVILSILFTWGLGLLIPILLRFVILKKPLSGGVALAIVAIVYFIQLFISLALDSKSKTHGALLLVAFVSYKIMRKGHKNKEAMTTCKECGNEIHQSATICNKCNKVINQ